MSIMRVIVASLLLGATIIAQGDKPDATADYELFYLRCSQQLIGVQIAEREGKIMGLATVAKKIADANPEYVLDAATFKIARKPTTGQ